jgi:hypothetical protein
MTQGYNGMASDVSFRDKTMARTVNLSISLKMRFWQPVFPFSLSLLELLQQFFYDSIFYAELLPVIT